MNKKNDTSQDATATAAGIRVGLQLWLYLLLSFVFLLKYPVPLGVLLGGIGGLAGGRVVTWWYTKDVPPPQPSTEDRSPEQVAHKRFGRRDRDTKDKRRTLAAPGWLLNQRRTLASKSKRR